MIPMTIDRFHQLPWHDAIIEELRIDRRRAGHVDDVVVSVMWPDERRSRIRFLGCRGFEARMNFGVVAAETVRSATAQEQTVELDAMRTKWKRLGVDLSELISYTLETGSTGSTIIVYAEGWIENRDN